jgi:hypothetical protein
MAAKPFLIYAAPNFLSRLKELGFQTYGDIWNEDYDSLEGPARWREIKNIIDILCSLPALDFLKIMERCQQISLYNRKVLAEIVLTDKAHAIVNSGLVP